MEVAVSSRFLACCLLCRSRSPSSSSRSIKGLVCCTFRGWGWGLRALATSTAGTPTALLHQHIAPHITTSKAAIAFPNDTAQANTSSFCATLSRCLHVQATGGQELGSEPGTRSAWLDIQYQQGCGRYGTALLSRPSFILALSRLCLRALSLSLLYTSLLYVSTMACARMNEAIGTMDHHTLGRFPCHVPILTSSIQTSQRAEQSVCTQN